ncbi:MAG: hypothetical protein E3K37_14210 [Candidatus Kuenenia sp.]|nr:hypothetical protein [Candidatus Kuenenia hertensis]
MNNYVIKGIAWQVNGEVTNTLREICNTIHQEAKYKIIRNGHFRKVLKYEDADNDESFYIKHYTAKGSIDRMKSLFAPSKAKREWDQGFLLMDNGLHTAEPIAMGEKRSSGCISDCYIISKTIPDGVSLKAFLLQLQKSPSGVLQKKEMLRNLMFYVKKMHDAGITHGELHAENIVVNVNNPSIFYLIDLGRTRFRKNVPLTVRGQELSRLLYSVEELCSGEELLELVRCYEMPRPVEILEKVFATKRRIWHSRTRKSVKRNNVFKIMKKGGYRINMRAGWDVDRLLYLIEKHSESLREKRENVIKISPKIGITIVSGFDEKMKSVCIKEYRYPSLLKRVAYSLIHSPARKAWLAAHGLLALKFNTPQPIALCECKKNGILEKSYIVMEDASENLPGNEYVNQKFSKLYNESDCRKKRLFVSGLADSFRQLHDGGVYHADTKANNILVRELEGTWNFYYLDLDRVYFNRTITRDERIRNLSQLNASMPNCMTYTDRLRFYKTYVNRTKLNDEDKEMIREIVRASIARKHVWQPGALVF